MTMKDLRTGPDWIVWVVFVILVAISATLLSGHGANLIAGYNTAPKEMKEKYDEKKLGRVIGGGLLAIAFLLPFAVLGQSLLPAWVAHAFLGFILVDCFVMIILANTICKKKYI
ncbi:MAG: DUF3784 domain-containing protein [Lachnospiraceae bacterium]|nr:DUF3784 domain-containing protein [Lachnospiraceae bacterium]